MSRLGGVYVHIPFCPQICPYCAFASLRGRDDAHERYIAALCCEIDRWRGTAARQPLQTVFFGGGTPTQVAPSLLGHVLDRIDAVFGIDVGAEITVEANPGTVDWRKFADLRAVGCNRLSLGVQSFDDGALKRLGRVHSAEDARRAYAAGRAAGFDNMSIDLIFSVPGVAEEVWRRSVDTAIELAPEHISAYALTIEEGTLFSEREKSGRLVALGEEEDAEQYEWTRRRLLDAGYAQYEVSNFAREGFFSRHNWAYWTDVEYLGIGLSAHSYMGGERFWNERGLDAYMERIERGESPEEGRELVGEREALRERIWLRLRTCQGVELSTDERGLLAENERIGQLVSSGLISIAQNRVLLGDSGWSLADGLALELTDILEREADRCQRA